MYQSIYYQKKIRMIHLWDDELGYKKFKYKNYGYKHSKTKTPLKDLFGRYVERVDNIFDYKPNELIESDLRPETRVLSDIYLDSDDVSNNINTMFYDIEVESTNGFPRPSVAKNKITAISMYFTMFKKYIVLLLDEEESLQQLQDKLPSEYNISIFKYETDLLKYFISLLKQYKPNIWSGWNINVFDNPYLYNRIKNTLGYKYTQQLSPINIVDYNIKINGEIYFKIAGVDFLDYISLFKQFNQNEESSYSLENISQKVLGRGKVKYTGSLDNLLKTDPIKFVEYSITDTELVKSMDDKLKFIDLARMICHKGHVEYDKIKYSSIWLEGASIIYLHRKGIIAPNKRKSQELVLSDSFNKGTSKVKCSKKIDITKVPYQGLLRVRKSKTAYFDLKYNKVDEHYFYLNEPTKKFIDKKYKLNISLPGAFVKHPQKGVHNWVYDLDLTSLYPSIIRSFGISYETKIGRVLNWNKDFIKNRTIQDYTIVYRDGNIDVISGKDFFETLDNNHITIATNGVMYDNSYMGFIPNILTDWFNERVEYKKLMKKYKSDGDFVKSAYYFTRQWTIKIMLNSFYGVMALKSFRFYDIDNAEAVTSSGQSIIKFSDKSANYFYRNELKYKKHIDKVIYNDTDSLILSSLPFINNYKNLSDNDLVDKTINVAKQTQKFVNESYDVYVLKYHNIKKEHYLEIKQEWVAKSSMWLAKKRYALEIVNEEGIPIENKLAVTGLDIVRSDFPPAFKTILSDVLVRVMKGVDEQEITSLVRKFKDSFKDLIQNDLLSIMMSTGVNNVNDRDYENRQPFTNDKGTPIHVKASLFHNDFLDKHKQSQYSRIQDKDKIKWTKLKDNKYNIDVIALKEQDNGYYDELYKFIQNNIDIDENFKSKLNNILKQIYDAMNWDFNLLNSKFGKNANKLFAM